MLLEKACPLNEPLSDQPMLELIFAIALPAIASALLFSVGASSGGTDIIAMILSKYTSLEIGKALLVSDFCIALFAGGLYGVRTGLYCVLGLLLKTFLVDIVIDGGYGGTEASTVINCTTDDFEIIRQGKGELIY